MRVVNTCHARQIVCSTITRYCPLNAMNKKKSFFIIDDDPSFKKALTQALKSDGQTVYSGTLDIIDNLSAIDADRPDCIVLPETHITAFLKELGRLCDTISTKTKVVVLSKNPNKKDAKSNIVSGVEGVISKASTMENILGDLKNIMDEPVRFTFWGVHGTLTVPGLKTARYGGNTPCVSLRVPGENLFIFDAGSGIKELSNDLRRENKPPIKANILISHPHWDHIQGLPFFAPLYQEGNIIDIYGPPNGNISLRELIAGQMNGVYFPINIKKFGAKVSFFDILEEQININSIKIQTIFLNHPGRCLGYRLSHKGQSFCYITDNEIYPRSSVNYDEEYSSKLQSFICDADALITDCTYMDDEYEAKTGWGHSSLSQVIELADRAGVKNLYLFHHDIDHTDKDIDKKNSTARKILKNLGSSTRCNAPKEGDFFDL